jgi:hypothetical protein
MDDNKIASSDGDSDEKAKQEKESAPQKEEWKSLVNKPERFQTDKDLAKSYNDLETKLGDQSEEIRKAREFAELVNPLLEEIRNDPEVFNKLDEKLRKKGQPNGQPETDAKKTVDQDEVHGAASDLIRTKFEERHGIDKLSPEEQKIARKKIGEVIYDLTGTSFNDVDLRRLNGVLENAYILANKDKLIEQSKLEALASAKGAEEAGISSIPSSQEKGETTLTPEEAKTAERLGLTRDQYIEGKKTPTKSK